MRALVYLHASVEEHSQCLLKSIQDVLVVIAGVYYYSLVDQIYFTEKFMHY